MYQVWVDNVMWVEKATRAAANETAKILKGQSGQDVRVVKIKAATSYEKRARKIARKAGPVTQVYKSNPVSKVKVKKKISGIWYYAKIRSGTGVHPRGIEFDASEFDGDIFNYDLARKIVQEHGGVIVHLTDIGVKNNPISYPNIEKSAFRKGEYVGYANGVWLITKTNSTYGNWIARNRDDKTLSSILAFNLSDMSKKLQDHADKSVKKNPKKRRSKKSRAAAIVSAMKKSDALRKAGKHFAVGDWYVDRKVKGVWQPIASFQDKAKAIEYAKAYANQHEKPMKVYQP